MGDRIYSCHVKNFVVRKTIPLRFMEPDWQKRAMQFVDIPSGDLNMSRYVEMLISVGIIPSVIARSLGPSPPL